MCLAGACASMLLYRCGYIVLLGASLCPHEFIFSPLLSLCPDLHWKMSFPPSPPQNEEVWERDVTCVNKETERKGGKR